MTLEEEFGRLLAGEHHDPHSLLGAHPARRGITGHPWSAELTLPPLGVFWLVPEGSA